MATHSRDVLLPCFSKPEQPTDPIPEPPLLEMLLDSDSASAGRAGVTLNSGRV